MTETTEGAPVPSKNQNLTIYLDEELADRVAAAKEAGTLDPKTVVKDALRRALAGPDSHDLRDPSFERTGDQSTSDLQAHFDASLSEARSLHEMDLYGIGRALGMDASGNEPPSVHTIVQVITDLKEHPLQVMSGDGQPLDESDYATIQMRPTAYELKWAQSESEVLNLVDVINEHEGTLVSVAIDKDGRYLVLIAWPQVEEDQEAEIG